MARVVGWGAIHAGRSVARVALGGRARIRSGDGLALVRFHGAPTAPCAKCLSRKLGHTSTHWVRFLLPFRWLAAAGFLLSLAVHVVSIAGIAFPSRVPVFALHVGVFVVWVPVVIATIRIPRGSNRRESFENALSGAPAWMSHGLQLLFL